MWGIFEKILKSCCIFHYFHFFFMVRTGLINAKGKKNEQEDKCIEVCDNSVKNDKETRGKTADFTAPRPMCFDLWEQICVCTCETSLHCWPCKTPEICLNSFNALTLSVSMEVIKRGATPRHFKRNLKDNSAQRWFYIAINLLSVIFKARKSYFVI